MKRTLFLPSVLLLFAASLSTATAQSTIFIVRHAEKADASKDPDLSAAGRARAESLVKMLKDANITSIYATEFKRTQQTAAPIARALGINATIGPASAPDFATKLRTGTGNALVVGHGNTIPDLIKAFGIDRPINIAEADYDNLFLVVLDEKPRLIRFALSLSNGDETMTTLADRALAILHEWVQSESLRRHCYAVADSMKHFAQLRGEDVDLWEARNSSIALLQA